MTKHNAMITTHGPACELYLTHDQKLLLADVVEAAMNQCREDCWLFDVGSNDWHELVTRAKQLKGLLAEIESTEG